ncbi:MAG TPA: SDR family NAD(P)-dependent oxidoreductase, partial [Microlunatus sp.]|nr:SDR family NAD(P)-dependent oxidoreductase [Microlunatus sp.]
MNPIDHDRSSVDGQAVFLVGAGSGIGRGTALLLARRGMQVICVDRDGESVQALAGRIVATGGTAVSRAADVTDPESV